jgi:uncharacterized MAPEG superfamily protein
VLIHATFITLLLLLLLQTKITTAQAELDNWSTTTRDTHVKNLTSCLNKMAENVKKLLANARDAVAAQPALALTRLAHDEVSSMHNMNLLYYDNCSQL